MDATTGATIVASVINSGSLNCRTNSSSSNSSSGYASGHSAASTPATPINSNYDTSTHTTHAISGSSSENLPTATVAPVTPFYSDTALGQQYRHQYYQSYAYPNTATQYSPVYDACTGNSYHNLTTPNVERSLNASNNRSQQRIEKPSKIIAIHNTSSSTANAASHHYGVAVTTTTCATTKPQATATPFFAQPSTNMNTSSPAYYDAYGKYKMPNATKLTGQNAPDYATSYTNHFQHAAAAAATLSYQQQQQHYYAAAKSQLQDVNYAAAVVKPHRQRNVGNSSAYYGSGGTYYDKYIYGPPANAAPIQYNTAMASHAPPSHPYSPHEPTSVDPYRKAAVAVAANAWHWNMEYAAATVGNCRNIAPSTNGAGYISTPNANSGGRDSFSAVTADKYGKYDKYGAYYASHHHPQQYIAPSTHSTVSGSTSSTRNLWPNTPHHSTHLAPVPAVINDRLPHTLPPSAAQHQYPHTHTHSHSNTHHSFATTANPTIQRPNCYAKPFQPQQACYYSRPTQQYPHVHPPTAYGTTQPTEYGNGTSSNNSHKYPAYSNSFKSTNSNDLYLASPFDTPPTSYNYGNSTTAMQQHYGGVAATGAAFYNDLNVQSAFESYGNNTIPQTAMLQSHSAAAHPTHHFSYQTHNTDLNNSTKSLLEYRKPLSTEVNDCYMGSTRVPLSNMEQHASNASSYLAYDIHGNQIAQSHAVIPSPTIYSDGGSSSEKSTPTTKNLSLRDFLTTWNEEEEEEINNASEQLSFIVENVENSNYVSDTDNVQTATLSSTTPQLQQQPSQVGDQQLPSYKNSYQSRPKIHVGITVDGAMDVEASQYFNLPDIIIDIEKSNNAGGANTSTATVESGIVDSSLHDHSSCGAHDVFDNFDVEKELDELQIKRAKLCLEKQLNNEIRILTPEPVESLTQEVIESEKAIGKQNETQLNQNFTTIHHTDSEKSSYVNAENFLKDIELNDNNSHSSNSSTFEKEYETFINRIDLDKTSAERGKFMRKEPRNQSTFINEEVENVSHQSSDIKTPPDPVLSADTTLDDSTQNLQDFTMFYKKKRKLMNEINEKGKNESLIKQLKPDEIVTTNQPTEIHNATESLSQKVFSETVKRQLDEYAHGFRKKAAKINSMKLKSKRRPSSLFYKLLRRSKPNTAILVQKHIAKLRERHLPLIKRKSFKNYSTCENKIYNPQSLLNLVISLINTKEFQEQIFSETENVYKNNFCNHKTAKGRCGEVSEVIVETAFKTTKDVGNVKESLGEPNSDSMNGSASLKEQEYFIGFEDTQNVSASPSNVQKIVENLAKKDENNAKMYESNNIHSVHFVKATASPLHNESKSHNKVPQDTIPPEVKCFEKSIVCENSQTNEEGEIQCFDNIESTFKMNNEIVDDTKLNFGNFKIEKILEDTKLESNNSVQNSKYDINASPSFLNLNEKNDELNNLSESHTSAKDYRHTATTTHISRHDIEEKYCSNEHPKEIEQLHDPGSIKDTSKESENSEKEMFVERNQWHETCDKKMKSSQIFDLFTQPPVDAVTSSQTLPMMRTKASVKMCDFSFATNKHNSTKSRSKSVSPTSGVFTKSKEELGKKHNTSAFVFDKVEKIDKTKFVEKWAASIDLTGSADISMHVTESIPLEHSTVEALDLSPSSRLLQKSTQIYIDSDSDSSSSSSTSSSSSSSNSKSNKSLRSTSSSSITSTTISQTSKSTVNTNNRNDISTDASDFNELKALERELSQHNICAERAQSETLKISNCRTDCQEFKQHNDEKTDKQIVKAEAQDIADLKKILESEQDLGTVSVLDETANVCTDNTGLKYVGVSKKSEIIKPMDMEECVGTISTKNQQSATLKNITEDIVAENALEFEDITTSKEQKDLFKNQIYQNEQQQNQKKMQQVVIPKLSDLCKIALNSSFVKKIVNFNENKKKKLEIDTPNKNESIPPNSPKPSITEAETTQRSSEPLTIEATEHFDESEQRELTVEEALAEMYRQAGVMSDHEDNVDDSHNPSDNGENQAQDFLLINLAEILENSDSENNVFVLQCDMNENLLRVMTTTSNANSVGSNEIDQIDDDNNVGSSESTLQLVQILNARDLEIISETNAEENISELAVAAAYDQNNDSLDKINEDLNSAFADLPIIHHEEIVPDNYKKFEKEQFIKYLHKKYVQKNIKKFHHANRILRKYRRHFSTKKTF